MAEDIEVDEDRSVEALAEVLDINQDNVQEEIIPVQKQVIAMSPDLDFPADSSP